MSSTPGPIVRPARAADADAIGEIHVTSWQAAYAGQIPGEYLDGLSIADRQARWRQRLERPSERSRVLVVEADQAVAGFCWIGPNRDGHAGGDTAELYALYLHSRHWRRGMGSVLHDHAIATMLSRGYRSATLWVLDSNTRARGFYERMGWHDEGTTKIETVAGGVDLREIRYRRDLATTRDG